MADSQTKLGFIGFGNMAQAMAQGLVECGGVDPARITACAAHYDKLQRNAARFGVNAAESAEEVVAASDMVIIAVKPYLVEEVVEPIRGQLEGKALVSIAAGCDYEFYEGILDAGTHHLSIIPNTPIAVGSGVISRETRHSLSDEEYASFEELFSPIALIEPVDSKLLGVATTIAGCGPAFAAMFVEALADAGVKHGLPRDTAYRLSSQMMAGTAKLQLSSGQHPGAMKDAVCSPGGTTIKGVASLEKDGFRGAIINAVDAIEGE